MIARQVPSPCSPRGLTALPPGRSRIPIPDSALVPGSNRLRAAVPDTASPFRSRAGSWNRWLSPRRALCLITLVLLARPVQGADRVQLDCTLWRMGGGVSGCGLLARYAAPGPRHVLCERTTRAGRTEDYAPLTVLTVIDPIGHTVAYADLTEQPDGQQQYDLAVPNGPAGIWRVSLQGGRTGDRITISLPPSRSWGVRGEMALGMLPGQGRSGWLWVPPGTRELQVQAIGGGAVALTGADGQALAGGVANRRGVVTYNQPPEGAVLQLIAAGPLKALAIDGVPGLLCADAATATDLAGGTVSSDGRLVEGPLQARARSWMVAALAADLDPHLTFPSSVPPDQDQALAALQLYGAYAPLSGLHAVCQSQILDPSRDDFGIIGMPGAGHDATLHGPNTDPFDALGLATLVTTTTPLNPAYGNGALTTRAELLAFYHIARLQGDDLLRESDLATTDYPMTHAFFDYLGSLSMPLALLKGHLEPTAEAIWRDAAINVGDRLADYHGYQTNQFWHVVLGHLCVYRATGEVRFRLWFERQVRQIIARPATSTSEFGQHPAGYFLENYGPDGNYDAISTTCLAEAWRSYGSLPDADPQLVRLLHDAIAKDLAFTSCHWLPQPDGSVVGPTAMVTRKVFSFADQGWPGTKLVRDRFPLAAAQFLLLPEPSPGLGIAELFPYAVNSQHWAQRALAKEVPLGDRRFTALDRGVSAAWTHAAVAAAELPVATPVPIPCLGPSGRWEVSGQIAWKQGTLYGLCFYDAPSSPNLAATCRTGGAPSALWTAATGAVLLSQHNTHFENDPLGNNGIAAPDDCTHACVFGKYDGHLWWSGRERATLSWLQPGRAWRINGAAAAKPAASVTWEYHVGGGDLELTATVALDGLDAPCLSLPFLLEDHDAKLVLTGPGSARFSAGGGAVAITWDAAPATISGALTTGIKKVTSAPVTCLRIPLLTSPEGWTRRVRFSCVP